MLSKVDKNNWKLGTINIIKYVQSNNIFINIIDNLEGYLLIKDNNKIFLFDYIKNIFIKNILRIRLKILGKYFWKQIESFDQNNIRIANKLRKFVINQFVDTNSNLNIFLGIGGESYIYFPFRSYSKYICISNHESIISDANFNLQFYNLNYSNYLVDYNNLKTFPNISSKTFDIIINVSNLHLNHLEYIKNLKINKLVIITCTPIYKKIPLIIKYFSIKKIKYFLNITSWITIVVCMKKNLVNYIGLGSNCSITYQLNKLNLRKYSYPFDWAKISINQLISVLENNFDNYTNLQIEKLSDCHLIEDRIPSLLIKNIYNIKFAHEVLSDLSSHLDKFKIKLVQRITRFNNLFQSNQKVKFIRIELHKITQTYFDSINILIKILEKYSNNFELLLILNLDKDIRYTNSKVIIYKFNDFSPDWKMNHLDWKNILFI